MSPNPRNGAKNPKEQEVTPLLKEIKESKGHNLTDSTFEQHLVSEDGINFPSKQPELQVYHRRWWVLGVFSLLAFNQAFVWITYSTFSISAKEVFGWTDTTIAMLVAWGNAPFIFFVLPMCWLLETKGLRVSTLLSSLLVVVGTGLRCISSDTLIATPLIHVAHILNGIAGIVFTSAPVQLSAAWFPAHQRTTATSISVLTNSMGVAFGYLVGPIFVPHPNLHVCDNSSDYEQHPCNNASSMLADIIDEERSNIMHLMYYECGFSVFLFLAALVYFPCRPPLPPSASATQERLRISTTILQLLKKRSFWIIVVAYGVTNSVAANWLGVLGPALEPFGITQAQTGVMGMSGTIVGSVLSLILARFVDYLGGKIKLCLMLLLSLGCISFVWYVLLFYEVIIPTLALLYPTVIMAGVVGYTGTPLFMEMCVEAVFPIQESVVGTVLQALMNLMGTFFLAIFLIPDVGVSWMNWVLIGTMLLGVLLSCIQKEVYQRSELDRAASSVNYQAINSSGAEDA